MVGSVRLLEQILAEIAAERKRQDEKWGEQNHPIVAPTLSNPRSTMSALEWYNQPLGSNDWREEIDEAISGGELCYFSIFFEELAEALEATDERSEADVRMELIQCAAVLVAMVERIDRNESLTEVKK